MKSKAVIITILLLIAFTNLKAQTNSFEIKGEVIDSLTSDPIVDAVVTLKGSQQNVFTNKKGAFTLRSETKEGTIVIYQLGYKTGEIIVNAGSPSYLIKLMPLAFNLNEVVVSSSKYKVVQENNNTSFLSFEFYENFIVALVSKGMSDESNFIQLLNLNGDILLEKKAPKNSERLFKDCLSNVQVITKDSAIQFYYNYKNIFFLAPHSLNDFYANLYRCQLYANGNYYFKDIYYRNLKNVYSYINENVSGKSTYLYTLADSGAIHSINLDLDLQYFLTKRRLSGNPPWDVKTIQENLDQLREKEPLPDKYLNLFRPVESELFKIDTCIYVFDYTNKKICRFTSANQLHLKDSLNFTHALKPRALIDRDFKKVYFLSNDDKSILHEYSFEKKQFIAKEKLENFHFVSNFLVKGSVIYFLYKNKTESIHNKLFIYRFPG